MTNYNSVGNTDLEVNQLLNNIEKIDTNVVDGSTLAKVKNFLLSKKYIIISIIVIGAVYFAYKKNYFNKFIKNNSDDNILDLNKDYSIRDVDNNPIKINLKEIVAQHNYYTKQEQQQLQLQEQQQLQLQEQQKLQLQEQQKLQEHKLQQQQKLHEQQQLNNQEQQFNKKNKHSNKHKNKKVIQKYEETSEERTSEENLNDNELEQLKKELAELEKLNNNV